MSTRTTKAHELGYVPAMTGTGQTWVTWSDEDDDLHRHTVMVGGNGIGKATTLDEAVLIATAYLRTRYKWDVENAEALIKHRRRQIDVLEKGSLFDLLKK